MNEYVAGYVDDENFETSIFDKISEGEIYDTLNRVVEELPDGCRKVYADSLNGKSQKEIAEELNITMNTVKKHINNANHYLKSRLKNNLLMLMSFFN